ncbi:unnamed protein product [Caenorhabditis auriculariae]|uniref:Secreted protein n=1 Tax=Caenorhabditis auriculariae TaxID=2777116 RepID=A0A8S1HIC4_9PELO|nr:unnamed protein product [Caenorhabditis auriculariae]
MTFFGVCTLFVVTMAASQLLGRSISKKGKTNVVRPEVTPKGSPFDVDKLALPATRKISKGRASFISRIIHFAETPESGYGSEPSEEEEERIEEEYAILGKGREKKAWDPEQCDETPPSDDLEELDTGPVAAFEAIPD